VLPFEKLMKKKKKRSIKRRWKGRFTSWGRESAARGIAPVLYNTDKHVKSQGKKRPGLGRRKKGG